MVAMKRLLGLLAVMVCGLATACGQTAQPAATTAAVTLIPLPTVTVLSTAAPRVEATPLATFASTDVLLVYHKSGCYTGIKDVMTVWQDGTLQLVNRKGEPHKSSVSPDRLTTVKQLIAQPEFAQLDPYYSATGADLCVYSVTTRLADGSTRSVTTMDGAPTPPVLMQVVKEVEMLWKVIQ
jgi:hypothetical protein